MYKKTTLLIKLRSKQQYDSMGPPARDKCHDVKPLPRTYGVWLKSVVF